MPLGVEIYATTDVQLDEKSVKVLNDDLIDQFTNDRFIGPDDCALTLVSPDEYQFFEDELTGSATLIEAHPITAYYGPGYERGYWPELATIIEFLRRRVPDSRVWYGEDCSGKVSETTEQWMSNMWDYWAANGGRPYHKESYPEL